MTFEQLQTRLDAMAKAMTDAGLRMPQAHVTFESGSMPHVWLARAKDSSAYVDKYEWMNRHTTLAEQLDEADAWIAALPDPETVGMREYMGKLSDAAACARHHSLSDDLVTPIVAVMQTVSGKLLDGPK